MTRWDFAVSSSFDSMNLLSTVDLTLTGVFILLPLRFGPLCLKPCDTLHIIWLVWLPTGARIHTETHTHIYIYWRQVNQRDEAHKTALTAGASRRSWCLSRKEGEERRQWRHCSVSDLGRTPGELSHMWLRGVNFGCTAGPWRHSVNQSDDVCVFISTLLVLHLSFFTPFCVSVWGSAVTVAAGQWRARIPLLMLLLQLRLHCRRKLSVSSFLPFGRLIWKRSHFSSHWLFSSPYWSYYCAPHMQRCIYYIYWHTVLNHFDIIFVETSLHQWRIHCSIRQTSFAFYGMHETMGSILTGGTQWMIPSNLMNNVLSGD